MIAMYLCRLITKASLPRIGDVFYRDHTTVLHAIRRIESTMNPADQTARETAHGLDVLIVVERDALI